MTSNNIVTNKIRLVIWAFVLFFIANLVLLVRWQILDYDKFVALARERVVDSTIPELRGDILARDGTTLAYSEPRFDIEVYKVELLFEEQNGKQTREEFVSKVAKVLEIEEAELSKMIEDGGDNFKIKSQVDFLTKEAILKLRTDRNPEQNLMGLRTKFTSKRIYPEGALACHVVGYVGQNDVGEAQGSAGLEAFWEGLLKEQEGFNLGEVDSFGNLITIDGVDRIEAKRGATIQTTIDKNIQQIVEANLKDGVERYGAKSGTIIVMDPKTGEIIALANYPNYDPNTYKETANNNESYKFKNLAITDPAELGSVGKMLTAAAALNEGAIQPDTIVTNGHQGCTTIKENERDWEVCTYDQKPQGQINATQALVLSDNLALYEISKLIGPEKLHDYLQAFGVGVRTDIDIAGESNGILKDHSQWTNVDSATYSFGHGYQMTSLQAITAASAIANDGKLLRPYIVSKIIESDGKTKEYNPVVVTEPVSKDTTDKLKDMLYEVYKSNLDEKRYKDLRKYKIAMKSGTATIPFKDRAGYSSDINATYIGFDASNEATFSMLVKLEEPKSVERLSYYSARLLWLDTFIAIKDHIGVPEAGW